MADRAVRDRAALSRHAGEAAKGVICGLLAGAIGCFLVSAVFYAAGRWGVRYLVDSIWIGCGLGIVAGVPIAVFKLRPWSAGLLCSTLAAVFFLSVQLVFVASGSDDPASPGYLGRFVFGLAHLLLCGLATGLGTALMVRAWP